MAAINDGYSTPIAGNYNGGPKTIRVDSTGAVYLAGALSLAPVTVTFPSGLAQDATLTNGNMLAKITDGSRTIVVKNTVPATTDNALVTVISPNQAALPVFISAPLPAGTNVIGSVTLDSSALTVLAKDATIASMSAKLPSLGQKLMAASMPVVISTDQTKIPVTGGGMAGSPDAGVMSVQGISGATPIPVSGTVSISTGSITATLASGHSIASEATLTSIDGKLPTLGQKAMAASLPVVISSNQTRLPVSGAGTVNVPDAGIFTVQGNPDGVAVPVSVASPVTVNGTVSIGAPVTVTGSVTASLSGDVATQTTLAAMSGKLPATLGTKVASNSLSVTVASDQSVIPVAISGTPTVGLAPGASVALASGSTVALASGATVALVSGTTVTLAGGSTVGVSGDLATQTTLSALNTKIPAPGLRPAASSMSVTMATDQTPIPITGTVIANVNTAALAKDTSVVALGAQLPATLGSKTAMNSLSVTFASNQSALPVSLTDISSIAQDATLASMSSKLPATLGSKTSANSLSVTFASDQSSTPLPVTLTGTSAVTLSGSSTVSLTAGTTVSLTAGTSVALATGTAVGLSTTANTVKLDAAANTVQVSGVSTNGVFGYARAVVALGTVSASTTVASKCAAGCTAGTPSASATFTQGIMSPTGGVVTIICVDQTTSVPFPLVAGVIYPLFVKTIVSTALTDIFLFI